jgi:hypothetical protein
MPGNIKSFWTTVYIAKDQNIESLPKTLYRYGIEIPKDNVTEAFADFFDIKMRQIVLNSEINPNIHNGKCKIHCNNSFFMSHDDCASTLKIKNCEGYDRIPQRVIKDGITHLLVPLSNLFKTIYKTKKNQDQWKLAKVNPIPKKAPKMRFKITDPFLICAQFLTFLKN